jgi:hypothetical protein
MTGERGIVDSEEQREDNDAERGLSRTRLERVKSVVHESYDV